MKRGCGLSLPPFNYQLEIMKIKLQINNQDSLREILYSLKLEIKKELKKKFDPAIEARAHELDDLLSNI